MESHSLNSMRSVHFSRYPFPPSSIPKPEIKPMRELRDDSLVDLKFMMEDSGMVRN